jgi:Spy/CpxP family protein refolding chaperone
MKKIHLPLLAATVLAASVAMAADSPPAGAPPGGPGGGGRGGRGGGGGMMSLTPEQRQTFQEALQKDNEKLRGLQEQLRTAQKELLQASLASTYDEKTVHSKAEAVAKIQTDITAIRAKALSSLAPSLSSEQKEQLVDSPMGGMLLMGGMGGGGGGFRGQGGPGGPGGGGNPPRNQRPPPQ